MNVWAPRVFNLSFRVKVTGRFWYSELSGRGACSHPRLSLSDTTLLLAAPWSDHGTQFHVQVSDCVSMCAIAGLWTFQKRATNRIHRPIASTKTLLVLLYIYMSIYT